MNRHTAGVIAPVFQALQALHQDGNDVAGADAADDATHGEVSFAVGPRRIRENAPSESRDGRQATKKYAYLFHVFMKLSFMTNRDLNFLS
jgi:hypothetical protein